MEPAAFNCNMPLTSSSTPPARGKQAAAAAFPAAAAEEAAGAAAAAAAAASGAAAAAAAAGRGRSVPVVLTVAGSDSGGGAGIQADVKSCAAQGVFCATAITAVTAQNTEGVQGVHVVPPDSLRQQLGSVLADLPPDVVKTGMLPTAAAVESLLAALDELAPTVPLVVDPVLVATSGDSLADASVLDAIRLSLLPRASLITPNLREAACLLSLPSADSIADVAAMREAARKLHEMGAKAVLLKGGHLPPSFPATDVFFDGDAMLELPSPRIVTRNTHGTGCTLASAIAANLARGSELKEAVKKSKAYISFVLQHSSAIPLGRGIQGPLNHFPSLAAWKPPPAGAVPPPPAAASAASAASGVSFCPSQLLLYAVTDSKMNEAWGRSMAAAVQAAVEGGATFIQIREKQRDTKDFIKEAEAALAICRAHAIPLVINDRVDVALAVGADGVHLGQSDMDAATARLILGPNKIIGVSSKTQDHAEKAWADGADYIGVGGCFPTQTKEDNTTIGVEGLREVCASSKLPVVAIGGIKLHNLREVLGGPRPEKLKGVAVVSAFFNQPDVKEATRKLRQAVDDVMRGT